MWQRIKWLTPSYLLAIAIPLGVGTLSALLTSGNMSIYSEIVTPPLSPPSWLFPVVWTALYILMGVSSGIVYNKREENPTAARQGLVYYGLSLIVNFSWSIIFFNMRSFLLAFLWIVLLLYLIIRTVISYHKVSPVSSYLQIPYIIWVCFAGYLNAAIYLLN